MTTDAAMSARAVSRIELAAFLSEGCDLSAEDVRGLADIIERFVDLQLADIRRRAEAAW